MAQNTLFQIKRWIMTFFAVVILVQGSFVCYAASLPTCGDAAIQLPQLEQLGRLLTLGLLLNLFVALVAAYGFNISIVNSIKNKNR